ncbi:MAG: hypothetical protein RLZZ106_546, partial [Cyanobacteriota bacterium]
NLSPKGCNPEQQTLLELFRWDRFGG